MVKRGSSAPVTGERSVIPSVREAGFVDIDRPAARAPPVVGQGLDVFLLEVFIEAWVRSDMPIVCDFFS